MTSKLPTYPEYKASGIDWLGDIPSHWNTVKGAWCCTFQYGFPADSKFFSNERKGVPLIRIRDIYSHDTEIYYNNRDFTPEYIVNNGDILIGMDGDFNVSRWKGGVSLLNQRVCKFEKSDSLIKGFLFYVLPIILKEINNIKYSTTVKHLSAHDLSEMRLPVPPLSEQEAIAAYLDDVTGKIDALISEKQKQVEDIRAYRTSLITETVTHGLNPDAPLRPSGIDWLGDIPEHWSKCRFKNFLELITAPSTSERKIGLENIESSCGKFVETDSYFEGNGIDFHKDDIVYGKLRPYLRKVWKAQFSGNAVGDFFVFRCNEYSSPDYIKYLFLSDGFSNFVNSSTFGAKMPRVSSDFIFSLHYYLPPLAEQQSIADFLDAKTAKIDELISELTKQIDELAEYKQAVITEAVTGKVDVCDYNPLI